jgi:hypothetical protein
MIGAGLAGGDWGKIAEIVEEESNHFQPIVYCFTESELDRATMAVCIYQSEKLSALSRELNDSHLIENLDMVDSLGDGLRDL